jgi:hypothetical protein
MYKKMYEMMNVVVVVNECLMIKCNFFYDISTFDDDDAVMAFFVFNFFACSKANKTLQIVITLRTFATDLEILI